MDNIESTTQATPDMGKVYDDFAEQFAEADKLATWRFVGRAAMRKLLAPSMLPGKKFLDLGAASGRVEAGVLLPGGVLPEDITGVEISPDQVEIAKQRILGATFLVGNIADPELPKKLGNRFDVVFSHMVFEHVDDTQFDQVCANAYAVLNEEGRFVFVVTHPDKMTDVDGNLVEHYGAFTTSAPWGGELDNFRRSVDDTIAQVLAAGFIVESVEELPFPNEAPEGLDEEGLADFNKNAEKYRRYPAIRLAVAAKKA